MIQGIRALLRLDRTEPERLLGTGGIVGIGIGHRRDHPVAKRRGAWLSQGVPARIGHIGDGPFVDLFQLRTIVGIGDRGAGGGRRGVGVRRLRYAGQPAQAIVDTGRRIGGAIDSLGRLCDPAAAVVLEGHALGRIGHLFEPPFAVVDRHGVVIAIDDGVGPACHRGGAEVLLGTAVQGVVAQAEFLVLGINLGAQIAVGIVGLRPVAHIGIMHGEFPTERVVRHAADVALMIGYGEQIVREGVGIGGGGIERTAGSRAIRLRARIFLHRDQAAQRIVGLHLLMEFGIDAGGRPYVVTDLTGRIVGMGGLGKPS